MSTTSSKNFTTLYSGSGSVTPQAPYGNANVVGLLSVGTDGANTVANISATGNVTASFFIGDGSQLTNLPTGTNYSNANVSAFLPTYTGNIGAGNISATGNVVTDGFFIGNFQGNISGNIVVPGLNTQVLFNNNGNAGASADFTFNDATNVMSVAGNIVAGNIAGSGAGISNITGANVTGVVAQATQAGTANVAAVANSVAGANVSGVVAQATQAATANVALVANSVAGANVTGVVAQATQAATANVANSVAGANVTGVVAQATQANAANTAVTVTGAAQANITSVGTLTSLSASGNITSSGNISGNYILGNGSQLTGLPATYGNANVAAYLPTYTGAMPAMTGNLTTTANVAAAFFIGDGSQLTGLPATYGNANVAAYLPTYTGNVGAGNIVMTGSLPQIFSGGAQYVQGSILGAPGGYAGLFARYAGNSATGSYVAAGVNAVNQVDIRADTQEWYFGANGNITLPSNTAAINYANGVNILSGVTTTYNDSNVVSLLAAFGSNTITTTGNVNTGNLTGTLRTGNQPFITNVGTLGSLNVTNDIIALGNVGSGNLSTSGILSAAGNVNASQNIVATGNITGGNLVTGGLITATGTISATGNIRSSANVVAAGNVVAQGFFIGDGSQLTNLPGGTYGNANVAAYLPTYTGNVGAGNIVLTGTENAVLGTGAGFNGSSGSSTTDRLTAIGYQAGNIGNASQRSTLVGWRAGYSNAGTDSVAVGFRAGETSQGTTTVAIGANAGLANQGQGAIAIGATSGNNQGNSSIVIGSNAGNAAVANSIVISTQGTTSTGPGLFIDPVRNDAGNIGNVAMYNPTSKEFTYANTVSVAGNITGADLVATAILTSTQQAVAGLANVGTTGNIVISGKNIATDVVFNPDAGNLVTSPLSRITVGTGLAGNIAFNTSQTRFMVSDSFNRSNANVGVSEALFQPFVTLSANVTAPLFRQQGISSSLRLGGGSAGNTAILANGAGAVFGFSSGQFNVEIGNTPAYSLGNTTVSHATINGGLLGIAAGSTVNNGFGFSSLVNVPLGYVGAQGNILNYTGYSSSVIPAVSGNLFMFYNGSNATASTRSVLVNNAARAAANYYFLMNEDDLAQVQLGSLRRYHEFQYSLATSGSVAVDKNNAQVQYLAPTANVDITGYSNFVTTVSDGTTSDSQSDTVTIIVQQGATPYTVTLPTGNAQIKYANAVSTVGTTANSVTTIQVQAIRDVGANSVVYLTTVSPEFV